MRQFLGPTAALLLALSCTGAPDISGELDTYVDHLNTVNSLVCDCPADLGYGTGSECSEAFGIVGADARACMEDALAGEESGARDYLECANEALASYELCLEANAGVCAEGQYFVCKDAFDTARDSCSGLPSGALDELTACTPTP